MLSRTSNTHPRAPSVVANDVVSDGARWQAASHRQVAGATAGAMHTARKSSVMPASLELGEFVRGLAHDIANPLNAMAMNAELTRVLLDRGDSAAARDALDRLLADTARCGRLVQSFQRFGAALQAGAREHTAAGMLMQAAIAQMQDELADTGIEFVVSGATDAQIDADVPTLARALAGVLRNAAEAGATTINVNVAAGHGNVRIEIADNGSGIEARWRERVSEPFFTTRRAQGASGLGLTLAQEIVRRHGGTLCVASGEPRGTAITVELPQA
jgi:signal transduction histidine kinase